MRWFKNTWTYLLFALIFYNVIVIAVILNNYYSFYLGNAHDFALHHHALWNTIHGKLLKTDIFSMYRPFQNWNLLKDHYYFFVFVLAPLYSLFREGSFLYISQILAISLSAIPLFLIAKRRLAGDGLLALLVSASYLLYPIVIRFPFHESRIEYYAVLLLFIAFYALEKDRIWPAIILLFLAGLCKEEVWLATAGIGAYIFFCKKSIRHHYWYGFFVAVLSLAIFYALIEYIPRRLGYYSVYTAHRMMKGADYINWNILNSKNYAAYLTAAKGFYFINLFKYLGFLPLLNPMIILSLPFFMINIFLNDVSVADHIWHSTLIIPFLFISLIFGLSYILRNIKWIKVPLAVWLVCFIVFYGCAEFYKRDVMPFVEKKLYFSIRPPIYAEFQKAKKYIPKEKSLFTQFCLLPNLSNRDKIYWLKNAVPDTEPEYQLPKPAEINTDYLFYSPSILKERAYKEEREVIEAVAGSGRYKVIFSSENFVVMAKIDGGVQEK